MDEGDQEARNNIKGDMAEAFDLAYTTWRTLLADSNMLCECGEMQSLAHLLICWPLREISIDNDLFLPMTSQDGGFILAV